MKILQKQKAKPVFQQQLQSKSQLISLSNMKTYYLEHWDKNRVWADLDDDMNPINQKSVSKKQVQQQRSSPKKLTKSKNTSSLPIISKISMPISNPSNRNKSQISLIPIGKARQNLYSSLEPDLTQNRRIQRQSQTQRMIVRQIQKQLAKNQYQLNSPLRQQRIYKIQSQSKLGIMIIAPKAKKKMEQRALEKEKIQKKLRQRKFTEQILRQTQKQSQKQINTADQQTKEIEKRKQLYQDFQNSNSNNQFVKYGKRKYRSLSQRIQMKATQFQISLKRQILGSIAKKYQRGNNPQPSPQDKCLIDKYRRKELIKNIITKNKKSNLSSLKNFIELKKESNVKTVNSVKIKGLDYQNVILH